MGEKREKEKNGQKERKKEKEEQDGDPEGWISRPGFCRYCTLGPRGFFLNGNMGLLCGCVS